MATLGVSTNTRLLAAAIIKSGRLIDYSIHLHKQPWSPSKANLIINDLEACVRRYCIKSIVLSMPQKIHRTEAFQYLFTYICRHFKRRGIPISKENYATLYTFCPTEQKKTKKVLMEALVKLFPELNYCLFKEQRNKNKYYFKLFEAVGVAALKQMK